MTILGTLALIYIAWHIGDVIAAILDGNYITSVPAAVHY